MQWGHYRGGSISLKKEGQTSDGGEHRVKLVRDEGCPQIFFQGLLALKKFSKISKIERAIVKNQNLYSTQKMRFSCFKSVKLQYHFYSVIWFEFGKTT